MTYKPKSKNNDIVVQSLKDEILIYDLKTNKALCLNKTSAEVWNLCDGLKSVPEIAELISKNLKTLVSEDFVRLAISDLQKEGLIENESNQFLLKGKSRREVIRKIGFASMIALPVISSLIAPNSVNAASSCIPNDALGCNFSGNDRYAQSNCCNSDRRCQSSTQCIGCSNGAIFGSTSDYTSEAACRSNYCDIRSNTCCNNTSPYTITYNPASQSCVCTCP